MKSNTSRYRTAGMAEEALSKLVNAGIAGWQEVKSGAKGGRPTRVLVLREEADSADPEEGDEEGDAWDQFFSEYTVPHTPKPDKTSSEAPPAEVPPSVTSEDPLPQNPDNTRAKPEETEVLSSFGVWGTNTSEKVEPPNTPPHGDSPCGGFGVCPPESTPSPEAVSDPGIGQFVSHFAESEVRDYAAETEC
jgi:hypothetical protein